MNEFDCCDNCGESSGYCIDCHTCGDCVDNKMLEMTARIASLEAQLKDREDVYIPPKGVQFSQDVADEFWRVWNGNGETHKHGFYESTWMAIWAALKVDTPKEQDNG